MIETRKLRLLFFSFWGCGGKKGFLGANYRGFSVNSR